MQIDSLEAGLRLVHSIKRGNGSLRPDDESPNMTTRCKLKEIESVDRAGLHTGDVPESADEPLVLGVDDEWSASLTVASVPHLPFSSSDLSAVRHFGNVGIRGKGFEKLNSGFRLGGRLD